MKTIVIDSPFSLGIVERPMPACGDHEVLLKIGYVGFCGSDLNTFRGLNGMVTYPRVPGHEISATVAAVGDGVPATLRTGMMVTVNPYTHCGHCAACRNRRYNACEHNETLGVQRDGAMSEYLAVPWEKVIAVDGIDEASVALIEPMSVGFHAVGRAAVTDADTVLVIGCGMVGMGAVIRSVRRGARVIACDVDDEKLAMARELGAAHTVNTQHGDVHARLSEITQGLMADVVIEAVGAPDTYQMAIDEAAFTGRIACIGYSKGAVSLQTPLIVKKELQICGSRNALPEDFRAVIDCLRQGGCPTDRFITAVCQPSDAASSMRRWHEAPGRVFRILVDMRRV